MPRAFAFDTPVTLAAYTPVRVTFMQVLPLLPKMLRDAVFARQRW